MRARKPRNRGNEDASRRMCSWALRAPSFAEALERRVHLAAHIVGSSTVYSTIQAAVNAASASAVITVDAGSYPELVTITKSLTIQGAMAGVDARTNARQAGNGESVVDGASVSDGISSGFYINANDVTIDGFTVEGNTSNAQYGAGIVIAPSRAGTHIVNNIIRDNVSGLFHQSTTNSERCGGDPAQRFCPERTTMGVTRRQGHLQRFHVFRAAC